MPSKPKKPYRIVRYTTPRVRKGMRVVHRLSVEDAEIVANIERCDLAIKVLKSLSTIGLQEIIVRRFGAENTAAIGVCIKDVEHLRQLLRVALRERLQ